MIYVMSIDSDGQTFAVTRKSYSSNEYEVGPASAWGDNTWCKKFISSSDPVCIYNMAIRQIDAIFKQHGWR